jgi:hypothetical protein
MSRMGREFTLVLLGSTILTAGYFLSPDSEEALQAKADEQAADRVTNSQGRSRGYYGSTLIWVHSGGYSGTTNGRPIGSTTGITRGGMGSIGRSATVGG